VCVPNAAAVTVVTECAAFITSWLIPSSNAVSLRSAARGTLQDAAAETLDEERRQWLPA